MVSGNYELCMYEIMHEAAVFCDSFMDMYELESEMIISAMEASSNASAPVSIKTGKGKGKFLTTLVQSFHRILQLFMNNSAKIRKKYTEWLQGAKKYINVIDYSKLQVNIDSRYMAAESNVKNATNLDVFRRLTDKGAYSESGRKRFFKGKPNLTSMETFVKTDIFRDMVSDVGSLSEGSKSHYRYGSPSITKQNSKMFSGNALKPIIVQCLNYCLTYDKTAQELSRLKDLCASAITEAGKNMEAVAESFVFIEESFISDTAYGLMYPMLEAEDTSNKTDGSKSSKPDVKMGGSEKEPNKGTVSQEDVMKANIKSSSAEEIKFIKYSASAMQIMMSSALTVAEERYVTYMKILRYALNDRHKLKDDNVKADGEDVVIKKGKK